LKKIPLSCSAIQELSPKPLLFQLYSEGMADTSQQPSNDWPAQARKRLEEREDRNKREREEQARKRKEGRLRGELSDSLVERLRSCNPQQLHNVILRCHAFLQDHEKIAPSREDCHRRFRGIAVLVSVPVGNSRYQYEKQPCGKNCSKCPNHGPYLYVYQRNGAYFPSKSLGKYPFKNRAPRKVLAAVRKWSRSHPAA
jgi:hypothetical protein